VMQLDECKAGRLAHAKAQGGIWVVLERAGGHHAFSAQPGRAWAVKPQGLVGECRHMQEGMHD
jgi:hypothetical protein